MPVLQHHDALIVEAKFQKEMQFLVFLLVFKQSWMINVGVPWRKYLGL